MNHHLHSLRAAWLLLTWPLRLSAVGFGLYELNGLFVLEHYEEYGQIAVHGVFACTGLDMMGQPCPWWRFSFPLVTLYLRHWVEVAVWAIVIGGVVFVVARLWHRFTSPPGPPPPPALQPHGYQSDEGSI